MSAACPVLVTFAPMVDSETSRLLLLHYAVDYEERDHLFGWASIVALVHGGTGNIPLLYGDGARLTGPRAIAEHYDANLPEERRLIPAPGTLRDEVEADWASFNGGIGSWAAKFAYFHLLPRKDLLAPIFAEPVPAVESWLTPAVYGLLRKMFTTLLKLSPEGAAEAEASIRATYAATDKRVADGRRFLNGDRLTLADIGLAGASAPLLLPPNYGAKMPALEAMPAPVAQLTRDLRATPTGAFVKRLYEDGFAAAAEKASAEA